MIYKPAEVTPVGTTAVLNTVEFVNGGDRAPRNRPSLAQAYQRQRDRRRVRRRHQPPQEQGLGAATRPDAGDGQGNCNAVRTAAAERAADWLASDPTGTGDQDVLLVGDYNSYAKEDPIATLEAGGFTNLVEERSGDDAYSYVFDGQWGYLDHALGSQRSARQVTGVADYHINSDEPSVLDYNTDFKSPAAGRRASTRPTSSASPTTTRCVVGLSPNSPATVTAAFADGSVSCGAGNASLTVGITDRDAADTHTATIAWGDGSSETVDPASASFTRTPHVCRGGPLHRDGHRHRQPRPRDDDHGGRRRRVHRDRAAAAVQGRRHGQGGLDRAAQGRVHRLRRLGAHRPGADRDGQRWVARRCSPAPLAFVDGPVAVRPEDVAAAGPDRHLHGDGHRAGDRPDGHRHPAPASLRHDARRRGGPSGPPRRRVVTGRRGG